MYKISSELLLKVTKAIDKLHSCRDTEEEVEKALIRLYKVNAEIKSKYDLSGLK